MTSQVVDVPLGPAAGFLYIRSAGLHLIFISSGSAGRAWGAMAIDFHDASLPFSLRGCRSPDPCPAGGLAQTRAVMWACSALTSLSAPFTSSADMSPRSGLFYPIRPQGPLTRKLMTLSRWASKLQGSEAAPPLRLAPVLTSSCHGFTTASRRRP